MEKILKLGGFCFCSVVIFLPCGKPPVNLDPCWCFSSSFPDIRVLKIWSQTNSHHLLSYFCFTERWFYLTFLSTRQSSDWWLRVTCADLESEIKSIKSNKFIPQNVKIFLLFFKNWAYLKKINRTGFSNICFTAKTQ